MKTYTDLTGRRFGRWTVISFEGIKDHTARWKCKCDCGNEGIIRSTALLHGSSKSCGCYRKDAPKKHGLYDSRLYSVLSAMKERCYNQNHRAYKDYGGRGITICEEWLKDFGSFYAWAMQAGYKEGLFIDRINNEKGYSPDNCRWVDRKTQQRNRRVNINIECFGATHCLSEWSEITGIKRTTIEGRLKRGWPIEKALTEPARMVM